jgi:hypothetical protein
VAFPRRWAAQWTLDWSILQSCVVGMVPGGRFLFFLPFFASGGVKFGLVKAKEINY